MYTSLVLVALAGASAPVSAGAQDPTWQEDYTTARTLGRQARKPLAVFVGAGPKGWDKLSETFSWVASRFSDVSDFRFDVEIVEVSGDMAYTLGFERFRASVAGRPVEPVTVRVTHIYRREDREWKIVHRHADNPESSHG